MNPTKNTSLKKHLVLSALGMGLQLAGSICLLAATLGAAKEVNRQIKAAIVQELSRQLEQAND